MKARRRHRIGGAGLAALALLALLLAAPSAATAKTKFQLRGGGYGHGVGMSQWGAYGYAKRGKDYRAIATHYYKKTKIDQVKSSKSIRVLLDTGSGVSFSRSKRACGRDLKPSRTYRAALRGSKVRLEQANGKRIVGCGGKLVAKGVAGPIQIGDLGGYRGDLRAVASGGKLYITNQVSLDDYVKGVIPTEMPASWPLAALQAQAVAARSYALATDAGGDVFDQYDDTRSQVYGGVASETAKTNRAVRKSRRQVLEHRGEVIAAYFFSSSGGRTENVEFGFPGAEPQPYLKSVRDPYDGASPDHRWRESFSRNEMSSRLDGLFRGRFQGIRVLKRGASPRVVKARILGSKRSSNVTGSDLRLRLDLRSTWFKVKRVQR